MKLLFSKAASPLTVCLPIRQLCPSSSSAQPLWISAQRPPSTTMSYNKSMSSFHQQPQPAGLNSEAVRQGWVDAYSSGSNTPAHLAGTGSVSPPAEATSSVLAAETAAEASKTGMGGPYISLDVDAMEIMLCFTLPTGQSFRWHQLSEQDYVGVIGPRLVHLHQADISAGGNVWYRVLARGEGVDAALDDAAIREYLNLPRKAHGRDAGVCLRQLVPEWSQRCERFKAIHPYFPGARMLRQDPVECLFQFICSSNNHISRIGGMVERLCAAYGTSLEPASMCAAATTLTGCANSMQHDKQQQQQDCAQPGIQQRQHLGYPQGVHKAEGMQGMFATPLKRGPDEELVGTMNALEPRPPPLGRTKGVTRALGAGTVQSTAEEAQQLDIDGLPRTHADGIGHLAAGATQERHYYAFPTLQQLACAQEADLRAAGFGYRARFIVESAAKLLQKEGGGEAWLLGLREKSYEEALEALTSLPGVGPKVAACVCLFSLDKHGAVPVDTHVWQIAQRWQPSLRDKSLTQRLHGEIQEAFLQKYGTHAGWAHNTLFIAELASQQHRLPPHLQLKASSSSKASSTAKSKKGGEKSSSKSNSNSGKGGEGGSKGTKGVAGRATLRASASRSQEHAVIRGKEEGVK